MRKTCHEAANIGIRALLLFFVGIFFAVVLNLLQVQRRVTFFPPDDDSWTYALLYSAWWVPPSVGMATVIIGLAYPCFDGLFGSRKVPCIGWSAVIRCVAVFVGINHASTKIIFTDNLQLLVSLAAMSLGLWFLFDRSQIGLILGLIISALATVGTQLLVYNGLFQYRDPDFLYIRSWLPCIYFSGGVTFGSIGRQLAWEKFIRSHEKIE